MTLLVVDTNALGRGQFSTNGLRRWMDSVGDGASIIVPEVVVWEWAEHASAAYAALQGHLEDFRVDPAIYPTPVLPERRSTDDIVKQIKSALPNSIEVWTPPDEAWKKAVLDQVLQRGTGERKNGVKTGASDSIVLSCVQDQVDNRAEAQAVVLATNDKGLREACRQRFSDEVLLAGSTSDLLKKLNAFKPADGELWLPTEEAIADLIRSTDSDIGSALHTFEMGFRVYVGPRSTRNDSNQTPTRENARLDHVDLVELHDLRAPVDTEGRRVGLADVRIFGIVHMTEHQLLRTADGSTEWVAMYEGPVTHGFIDLTVAVTWNQHWKVQSVAPASRAVLVFDSSEYDDSDDVPPFYADAAVLD